MIELLFIRHGKTAGNLRHNYVGITDEPLCPVGLAELGKRRYAKVDLVFCSPMLRCRQTTALLYPDIEPYIIEDMRECDFGEFENQNYQDLSGKAAYQQWLDSNGESGFPGGETREEFVQRCCRGFEQGLAQIQRLASPPQAVAFVVHGGTIMALLSQYTGRDYFSIMCENGGGYKCRLDWDLWQREHRLADMTPLGWEEG